MIEKLLSTTDMASITLTIATLVISMLTYITKERLDMFSLKKENKEIEEAKKTIHFVLADKSNKNSDKNVIRMMQDNVEELREYYVISKQQARKSFSAALLACIFGVCIYIFGIVSSVILKVDVSIISVIGGTVTEVIAALFFWLYKEATNQLGVYHQRLGSTEKYLTVIQIIKELPEDKKYEEYSNLIEHILLDNQEIVKHDFVGKDKK